MGATDNVTPIRPDSGILDEGWGKWLHRPPSHGGGNGGDNDGMNGVPREELTAKLEAIEARMDSRMAGVESKIDTALAEMRADRHRFDAIDKRMDSLGSDIKDVERSVRESSSSMRTTMIVTAIGTVVGLAGVMITMLGYGQDSFSAGREQGSSLSQAAADIKATQEQLIEMQERMGRAAVAPTTPAPAAK